MLFRSCSLPHQPHRCRRGSEHSVEPLLETTKRAFSERDGTGIASSQVLQEFYAVATRKLKPPMAKKQARGIVASDAEWCRVAADPELIVAASVLEERHTLNFWDALIVEAAQRSMASTLLSEGLQDGRMFGDIVVENPFRGL